MSFYVPILFLVFIFGAWFASGEIYVTDRDFLETKASYRSMPARFGPGIPDDGLKGRAVLSEPQDGCRKINPPPTDKHTKDHSVGWVVVISRGGGCNFETKLRVATAANWTAAIVYNSKGKNDLVPMAGDDDEVIPGVFMGYDDAMTLLYQYSYAPAGKTNLRVVITDEHAFDINQYLLPFAIVVGICFVIMLVIVIYKCIQDYRRHRRHRLPKSALKKLPIHKFKDGDPFETCVICLDDFQDGDKLRVLPCDHGYHAKCIDPWLVKTKRICPQCRKKVFQSNDRGAGLISASDRNSDSDSDTDVAPQRQDNSRADNHDSNATSNQAPEDNSTSAPLLGRRRREYRFFRRGVSGGTTGQRSRRAAGGGTFTTQSSVHAPPRNTTVNAAAGDVQVAGPSGLNRQRLSAVEKLQRAFAKESRQIRRGRDANYRRFQNETSSDNEYHSAELSDDTSDDEQGSTSHQQRSVTGENVETQQVSPPTTGVFARCSTGHRLGAKGKSSARHVNAEVHVAPLDDETVVRQEANSHSLSRDNKSSDDNTSQRSQNCDLSEKRSNNSRESHVVEIHPELSASMETSRDSPSVSRGDSGSGDENKGGNVEIV